jgi:hypothetical protein
MPANVLDEIRQDVRFPAYSLSKTPAFAASAILSLSLGIGATTTVFSVVDALLLRPLPVTRPERLVTPEQLFADGVRQHNFSHSDFERFHELIGSGVFEGVAATSWADAYDGSTIPDGPARSEALRVSLVTADYFRVLGVAPRAGRAVLGDDDRSAASPVAVIGDGYWARRFDRSPAAIGHEIRLNGSAFTIVGIAPRGSPAIGSAGRPTSGCRPLPRPRSFPPPMATSQPVFNTSSSRDSRTASRRRRREPPRIPYTAGCSWPRRCGRASAGMHDWSSSPRRAVTHRSANPRWR